MKRRPAVLIFAGSDPGGGAGLQADIQAVAAVGAHPLSVITALTVQDNDRVFDIQPTSPSIVQHQALALMDKIDIAAVKIGIVGSCANARVISDMVITLRQKRPDMPVVLDPVLASGHGDALSVDHPVQVVRRLLPVATIVTPNLPETVALCDGEDVLEKQAAFLRQICQNVLIKGGHGSGAEIVNRWFGHTGMTMWTWPRLEGSFHGTGCTLASAIAALLALDKPMVEALGLAQTYCHRALVSAYAIAEGQCIPNRWVDFSEEHA